uniref:Uncharacterized protein n=1 Tax=Arundo donax TaxID=35708 RepID=A0A0A8YW74_ARUDO
MLNVRQPDNLRRRRALELLQENHMEHVMNSSIGRKNKPVRHRSDTLGNLERPVVLGASLPADLSVIAVAVLCWRRNHTQSPTSNCKSRCLPSYCCFMTSCAWRRRPWTSSRKTSLSCN